jgi:hypothetical protein
LFLLQVNDGCNPPTEISLTGAISSLYKILYVRVVFKIALKFKATWTGWLTGVERTRWSSMLVCVNRSHFQDCVILLSFLTSCSEVLFLIMLTLPCWLGLWTTKVGKALAMLGFVKRWWGEFPAGTLIILDPLCVTWCAPETWVCQYRCIFMTCTFIGFSVWRESSLNTLLRGLKCMEMYDLRWDYD